MTITTERLDELEAFYANHTFPQPFATHAVDFIAEVRRLQSGRDIEQTALRNALAMIQELQSENAKLRAGKPTVPMTQDDWGTDGWG